MSIGEQLRQARIEAGVSQASLARRAGTSQAAISRIERGLEQPGVERFAEILAGLGLRPAFGVEPVAVIDASPGQLAREAAKTPQDRFESGLNWDRFLRDLDAATETHGGFGA